MRRDLYYIYPRDKRGNKTGHTIAVITKDNKIFHGMSLCSANDQFNYKEGRKLALERAEAAYAKHLARTQA